jgi:hypothetical protein
LRTALDEAVKAVNFIKAQPFNSLAFHALCEQMCSVHKKLVLSQVNWLSRRKANVPASFHYQLLAYLSHIFTSLNDLNMSIKGTSVTIFEVEVEAIILKLGLWSSSSKGVFESFSAVSNLLNIWTNG